MSRTYGVGTKIRKGGVFGNTGPAVTNRHRPPVRKSSRSLVGAAHLSDGESIFAGTMLIFGLLFWGRKIATAGTKLIFWPVVLGRKNCYRWNKVNFWPVVLGPKKCYRWKVFLILFRQRKQKRYYQ